MPEPRDDSAWARVEESLRTHAQTAAQRALGKLGGPLVSANLAGFLGDSDCIRYPTEIVYDGTGLDPHQFAEPFFEDVDGARHCRLHVHPRFAGHPEALPYFVAYMAGAINYGKVVSTQLCEAFGAALVGMEPDAFYEKVCALYDAALEDLDDQGGEEAG